ncbi:MAG TPA: MFS transporter, partial [Nonomuraea sp.]|nr:MFS transporter [Nonomuraea sp.]
MNSNAVRDPRRWWVLAVLCLSLMVLSVDGTILNLAIPSLIEELGATPSDVQWILDVYVLAFAGLLLT